MRLRGHIIFSLPNSNELCKVTIMHHEMIFNKNANLPWRLLLEVPLDADDVEDGGGSCVLVL